MHPAWKPAEAEWVTLAPGVRWLLKRPDGVERHMVAAEVTGIMTRALDGRQAFEEMGLAFDGDEAGTVRGLDLDRVSSMGQVLAAVLIAQRCLKGWEGFEVDGVALDHTDPEAVRSALILGAPDTEGTPLLAPFMAWLEKPRQPMAAETRRLRQRAEDWFDGGQERCAACRLDGETCAKGASAPKADDAIKREMCPQLSTEPQTAHGQVCWQVSTRTAGMWRREGLSGRVTGLDYGAALLAYEAEYPGEVDHGAAFAAFRAIEAGALAAAAKRAQPETDPTRS